jgi:hypothetical protein
MPTYRVHFAASHTDPIPPVESLVSIEANDPVDAVDKLCRAGQVPQAELVKWARVVLAVAENGRATRALRVPVMPSHVVPLDWDREERDYRDIMFG